MGFIVCRRVGFIVLFWCEFWVCLMRRVVGFCRLWRWELDLKSIFILSFSDVSGWFCDKR